MNVAMKRTLIGLVVWLVALAVFGYLILEPEHRTSGLLLGLSVGTVTYLTGEWLRGRRRRAQRVR